MRNLARLIVIHVGDISARRYLGEKRGASSAAIGKEYSASGVRLFGTVEISVGLAVIVDSGSLRKRVIVITSGNNGQSAGRQAVEYKLGGAGGAIPNRLISPVRRALLWLASTSEHVRR